jgi:Cof subfamily protein (haloacid dehalogenase superfamily)
MMKYIFLDIDGTIYNSKGTIPQSTVDAIALAQSAGHKVLLCTGRSHGEIGSDLKRLHLDGMIGAAGACIEYEGEVIYHRPLTTAMVQDIVSFLEKHAIAHIVENNDAIYGNEKGMAYVYRIYDDHKRLNPDLPKDFLGTQVITEDCRSVSGVNKILFFDAPYTLEEIRQIFANYTVVTNSVANYGKCSGEISERGMSKAKGMEYLLTKLGIAREDTIAIGDGANDLEMITYAGVGIAMGNSIPQLLELADDVTASVEDDGIYKAFCRYGLISE